MDKAIWMTAAETEAVKQFTQKSPGDILEIGTFRGGTTKVLAKLCPAGYCVWSIDVYGNPLHLRTPDNIWREDLREFHNTFLVVGDSLDIGKQWTKPLGLVLVDGSHDGGVPQRDWDLWARHIVPRGYVLIHDSCGEGPYLSQMNDYIVPQREPRELIAMIRQLAKWEVLEEVDTLAIVQRRV